MKKWMICAIISLSCLLTGCGSDNITDVEKEVDDIVGVEGERLPEEPSSEKSIEENVLNEEMGTVQEELQEGDIRIKGKYSGWICGLVSNEESDDNSDVLLINPETKEIEVYTTLQGVYQTQTCAVSPDGSKVAYTQWADEEDTRKGVCIMVSDAENNVLGKYFSDNGYNPLITAISWMPDNETLLFNISIEDQPYYSDAICLFNMKTEQLQVIDQGRVWRGNEVIDGERDIEFPALSQKELNELIDKYGGNVHIPVEENGSYNYVEIGAPILSPDQTKIAYMTNFCRNMAFFIMGKEPQAMLCLASGIFIADVTGEEEPVLIFSNAVERSRIGKVIWGRNDNEIIFDRYYNEHSKGVCDLVLYNIDSGEEKVLIKSSPQMETQKARFMVGNNGLGFCSDGENGEGMYYYDLITDTCKKESIVYNGRELVLWRFCEIY